MGNSILIKGAQEHNLKNIDVEIPRDKLVVIGGMKGLSPFAVGRGRYGRNAR
ncbi:MAG: hypothetical protein KF751_17950 [Nitrospira sp.]|nr:hypothetical protein [Nitrospira sp.]MBX3350282.1 hypothetical protein [Nitrospira sp.]